MATGDISSVTARSDGISADVVVSGFTTGATYSYGLGTNADPSTSKAALSVASLGYNTSGVPTTKARTVHGVITSRKAYPNQTSKDETGGGNLTFRMILEDYVYSKDKSGVGNSGTDVTTTISSGLVTNSGGASETSNSATNLATTNNSSVAYPKVIGHWAIADRQPVNGTIAVEFHCAHKYAENSKPVACVKFTATGQTSAATVTATVTSMTLSARGDSVSVYAASLDVSTGNGFTRGELVKVRAQCYPWVGDSSAILDTTADAGTQVFQLADLNLTVMDKMICVVDAGSGNDGTCVASATQATADASPAATINGALTAIMAANNSAYSLNRCDGGEVQLKAGNYTWAGGTGTVTNGYFTLCPHSSTNRAGVVFNQTSANYQRAYQRFYNVTFTRPSTGYMIFAANPNVLVMESVSFSDSNAGAWYSGDTNTSIDFIDCTHNNGYFNQGGTDGHSRLNRNTTYTATTPGPNNCGIAGNSSAILAWKSTSTGGQPLWRALSSAGTNNFVIALCKVLASTDEVMIDNVDQALTNVALIGNLIERTGSVQSSPIVNFSSYAMSNIVMLGNSCPGNRCNFENSDTSNVTFTDVISRYCAFDSRGDHRYDISATNSALTGTWQIYNSVGWSDNHNEARYYAGDDDFFGVRSNQPDNVTTWTTPVSAGWKTNASYGGTNSGNGNYTPDTGSPLLNRLPSGKAYLPYDLFGNAIPNDGTGSIGAVQLAAATIFNPYYYRLLAGSHSHV